MLIGGIYKKITDHIDPWICCVSLAIMFQWMIALMHIVRGNFSILVDWLCEAFFRSNNKQTYLICIDSKL